LRTFLVAFLMALGIAALSTSPVLHLARWLRLFDQPDGVRKIHRAAIPRLGGIALAAGYLSPLVALLFYTNTFAVELREQDTRLHAFFLGAMAILGLGVYDDIRGCGAWAKLGVQSGVGLLLWYVGLRFDSFSVLGATYELGMLSLPLTLLWVAGIINAMNLIDGMDGLAAGVSVFASLALFLIAIMDGNPILALFASALGGACLGFLLYNFSPALIFMGDSGSMGIGYMFAVAGLWTVSKRSTALALLLPAVALGLPIADTFLAFGRRALRGRSPFHSDREHIHHRLLDLGLSPRQAVLWLYLACSVLTVVVVMLRAWVI
jgi:UDP-GlcNAc:undecaprenyl-phosphate GlcNAc-1-phosphate transferase